MPFVSQREYDDFKRESRRAVEKIENKVDSVIAEVGKLRADLTFIAKVLAGVLVLATLADPFIIWWLSRK